MPVKNITYQDILKILKEQNVKFPEAVAAQMLVETNNRKTTTGNVDNTNLFNIHWNDTVAKRFKKANIKFKKTTSKINDAGENVYLFDFDSVEDAVKGYKSFIEGNTSKRYDKALKATTPEEYIKELHKAGYATDPNYSKKVISVMKKYDIDVSKKIPKYELDPANTEDFERLKVIEKNYSTARKTLKKKLTPDQLKEYDKKFFDKYNYDYLVQARNARIQNEINRSDDEFRPQLLIDTEKELEDFEKEYLIKNNDGIIGNATLSLNKKIRLKESIKTQKAHIVLNYYKNKREQIDKAINELPKDAPIEEVRKLTDEKKRYNLLYLNPNEVDKYYNEILKEKKETLQKSFTPEYKPILETKTENKKDDINTDSNVEHINKLVDETLNPKKETSVKKTEDKKENKKEDDVNNVSSIDNMIKGLNAEIDDLSATEPETYVYNKKNYKKQIPFEALGQGLLAIRGLQDADTEIPRRDEDVSSAMYDYLNMQKEISTLGLPPEVEAQMKDNINTVFKTGIENITNTSGGDRNAILGNIGKLTEGRMKALAQMDIANYKAKEKAIDLYGKTLEYINGVHLNRDIANKEIDIAEARQKRAEGKAIANNAFSNMIEELQYQKENGPGSINHQWKEQMLYKTFGMNSDPKTKEIYKNRIAQETENKILNIADRKKAIEIGNMLKTFSRKQMKDNNLSNESLYDKSAYEKIQNIYANRNKKNPFKKSPIEMFSPKISDIAQKNQNIQTTNQNIPESLRPVDWDTASMIIDGQKHSYREPNIDAFETNINTGTGMKPSDFDVLGNAIYTKGKTLRRDVYGRDIAPIFRNGVSLEDIYAEKKSYLDDPNNYSRYGRYNPRNIFIK